MHEQIYHESRAKTIGYRRSNGYTLHSHATYDHEKQTQHNIHQTRKQQYVKRTARVAHAAQDGGSEIEDQIKRYAYKDNAQITHCHVEHTVGSVYQYQQRTRDA